MQYIPEHCPGRMFEESGSVSLCRPLAQLKREHGPLREQMDDFARLAGEIAAGLEPERLTERLAELIDNVGAFVPELESHSEREEGSLFPLMSRYIGRETGPIAVMEYEHDQAKIRLQMFQDLARQAEDNAAEDRAKELAAYALQAHAILTEHFMKEENVLFPMAERILTPADKEQLARAFRL